MNKDTIKDAALVATGVLCAFVAAYRPAVAGDIKQCCYGRHGIKRFWQTPNDLSHHPLYNDNMQSYKINTHRHIPEIIRTAQIDKTQPISSQP